GVAPTGLAPRRAPLCRWLEHLRVHDQSVAVLCDKIAVVAEFGFLTGSLPRQPSIHVCRGFMGFVAALLTVETHGRIPWIIRRRTVLLILTLEALQARP